MRYIFVQVKMSNKQLEFLGSGLGEAEVEAMN